MAEEISNNKRIAKNTLMLYLRMFFVLGISLYTSRLVLQVLGVSDYGIYNVVGGAVAMFGFINSSLSGASARFITYALGDKKKNIRLVFNTIISVHYIFAAILFLLAETLGLWLLTSKLVIPQDRFIAAFWVYQSTVFSSVIILASSPFNALIVAHEKMSAFAYISIFEVSFRLIISYLLFVIPYDKLIAYAFGVILLQIMIRILYMVYCRKNFVESHYQLQWDKKQAKEIFSYAGWVLNGELAAVGYTQGINILLNMFFGPVVNAARGISVQVQTAVMQFSKSFLSAVRPQIIKSFANGDLSRMHQLVLTTSRLSTYLMLIITLPLLFKMPYVLNFWLTEVPDNTIIFVRIMLICCIIDPLSITTIIAVQATGDIRKFQIIEGSILLSIVPIAYLMLKFFQTSPQSIFLMYLLVQCFTQLIRVWIVYPQIKLPIKSFYSKVLFPLIKVCIFSLLISYLLNLFILDSSLLNVLLYIVLSFIGTISIIFIFGIRKNERIVFVQYIKRKFDLC